MADVQVADNNKGKKNKVKKLSTHVDFTPMVDLGFLLITFFMLATSLVKPQTMEISVPSNKDVNIDDQTRVKASQAVSILIGEEGRLYYFFGSEDDPILVETDYSSTGLRGMLMQRNADVMNQVSQLKADKANKLVNDEQYEQRLKEYRDSKDAPIVMIKAADNATYGNLVDVLDEMQICNIARYTIVDITPEDLALIENYNNN